LIVTVLSGPNVNSSFVCVASKPLFFKLSYLYVPSRTNCFSSKLSIDLLAAVVAVTTFGTVHHAENFVIINHKNIISNITTQIVRIRA